MSWQPSSGIRLSSVPLHIFSLVEAKDFNIAHQHAGIELHFCHQGRGQYEMLGHSWSMSSTRVTLLLACIPHRVEAQASPVYWRTVIEFWPQMLTAKFRSRSHPAMQLMPNDEDPVRQFEVPASIRTKLHFLLNKIKHAYESGEPNLNANIDQWLTNVFALLSHPSVRAVGHSQSLPATLSPHERRLIAKVKELVHQCLADVSGIDDIASFLGLSPGHLRRVFKRGMGIGLGEYMAQHRMAKAQAMLWNGATVTRSAFECGYRDVSSFSRAFKRQYGVSPSSLVRYQA